MHRLRLRRIELAVQDAGTGAHALHLARPDHRAVAEAVLVLERSLKNIGDDFHVIVTVAGEPGAWNNAILVDDPQAPEAHMGRVLIMREGESVAAVQPSSPALAARHAISKGNHRFLLWHRGKDVTTGVCHLQS